MIWKGSGEGSKGSNCGRMVMAWFAVDLVREIVSWYIQGGLLRYYRATIKVRVFISPKPTSISKIPTIARPALSSRLPETTFDRYRHSSLSRA